MTELAVSLVVVAHGRRDLLDRLLISVERHTAAAHEVVVVDNASPDDTASFVASEHPSVRLIDAGENLGYGRGANLGVRHSLADRVALLNSDVEVTAGWLPPLLQALARPGVGIAAPRSVDQDGCVVEVGATVTSDGHVHIARLVPASRPRGGLVIVPHASAACWVFDRRWFERVGGFDPAYGLGYYEDLDLSAVAESTGAAVVVQPASTVRHDVGGSFTSQTSAVLSHRNH